MKRDARYGGVHAWHSVNGLSGELTLAASASDVHDRFGRPELLRDRRIVPIAPNDLFNIEAEAVGGAFPGRTNVLTALGCQ